MKIRYLKLKQWFLASLTGLLGLNMTSCLFGAEYGCPEVEYKVKGTVTNPQGEPIEGIEAFMLYRDVLTDSEGKYDLTVRDESYYDTVYVRFRDIDSTENGLYADTIIPVDFSNATFTGGHGWFEGSATKTADVTLRPIADKTTTE